MTAALGPDPSSAGNASSPVVELDQDAFAAACDDLSAAVSEFEPDLLVGIATGGEVVAATMVERTPVPLGMVAVRIQRPATGMKGRVPGLLKRLPPSLSAVLRRMEVACREMMLRRRAAAEHAAGGKAPEQSLVGPDAETVRSARRILVVDDTVDSGRTLNEAVAMVRATESTAAVRTAVITSTWKRPPVRPDYCLYERTLVRFPWSFDA